MADTTYADGTTPAVNADWLNDVNRLHYTILSDPADAAAVRTALNVEDGATADQSDSEIETAYNNQVTVVSQAEAEAGVATTVRRWTAQRVGQAVTALAPAGLSATNILNWSSTDTLDSGDTSGYAHVIVWADASAGSITVTLPSAANFNGALITVVADADPGSNSVTVNNSAATEVSTLYELQDFATFSSDGSSVRKVDEWVTVHGKVYNDTGESNINAASVGKLFDESTPVVAQVGGWGDFTTNYRVDVGFDCIIHVGLNVKPEATTRLVAGIYVDGSIVEPNTFPGTDMQSSRGVWAPLKLSSGSYIEFYAKNTDNSANDGPQIGCTGWWNVIKRLD